MLPIKEHEIDRDGCAGVLQEHAHCTLSVLALSILASAINSVFVLFSPQCSRRMDGQCSC